MIANAIFLNVYDQTLQQFHNKCSAIWGVIASKLLSNISIWPFWQKVSQLEIRTISLNIVNGDKNLETKTRPDKK